MEQERYTLPWWRMALYGCAGLGLSTLLSATEVAWFPFLSDVARLPVEMAGVVFFVSFVWNAINDPIVGLISDRTRSRFGRRRVYFLTFALPLAVLYVLIWWVWPIEAPRWRAAYFIGVFVVYEFVWTLIDTPREALGPELTLDYEERNALSLWKTLGEGIGFTAGAVLPLVLVETFAPLLGDEQAAYRWMAAVLAGGMALGVLAAFFGTYERSEYQKRRSLPVGETIRSLFRNRAYVIFTAGSVMCFLFIGTVMNTIYFFVEDHLRLDPDRAAAAVLSYFLSGLLPMPFWMWVANRVGKKATLLISIASAAIGGLLAYLLEPGVAFGWIVAVYAFWGGAAGGFLLAGYSALMDCVEEDELATGCRQEGAYLSAYAMAAKIGEGIAGLMVGQVLGAFGFVEGAAVQPTRAVGAIRWMGTLVPAGLMAAAFVITLFYPITRERHEETLRLLIERSNERRNDGTDAGRQTETVPQPGAGTRL